MVPGEKYGVKTIIFFLLALKQLLYRNLIWLCFYFSTVLVWDTRPSKSAAPAHATGQNPAGTLPTFKHLDLTWKPVLRVFMYMLWNFVIQIFGTGQR